MSNITQKVQIEASDIFNRLLEVKGITSAELIKRSGLSRNFINDFKKGKTKPIVGMRLSTIRTLANAFDVPPQLFLKAPYIIAKEKNHE